MNLIRRILSLFPFVYAGPGSAAPEQIISVEITGSSFIRELTSETEIKRFEELWKKKVRLTKEAGYEEVNLRFACKILISSNRRSTLWLYSPRGSAVVLSVFLSPVYQLPDVEAFNALVGCVSE
jgi:hypothetical protein